MSNDDVMTLPDGSRVLSSAVVWAVDAEFRGLELRRLPSGLLRVGPRERVTPDDLDFCRQHKPDLLAIVAYLETCEGAPC
jgi:hypothetical protein